MRLVGESAIERDIRDELAAVREPLTGALDTQASQPLVRRLTIDLFEHSNEMEATEARDLRQILERNGFAQMRMHVVAHALHSKSIPRPGLLRLVAGMTDQQMHGEELRRGLRINLRRAFAKPRCHPEDDLLKQRILARQLI